jgi:hypothetical protein
MKRKKQNKLLFTQFVKSSWSGKWGGVTRCVEVAQEHNLIAVRDSKNPNKGHLTFDKEEWDAFLKGAKAGEFDLK